MVWVRKSAPRKGGLNLPFVERQYWVHDSFVARPNIGNYGLRQLELPDGGIGYWTYVQDDVKPSLIDQHGTMVVLLGNEINADSRIDLRLIEKVPQLLFASRSTRAGSGQCDLRCATVIHNA